MVPDSPPTRGRHIVPSVDALRVAPFESLTTREFEILQLLASGATNAQMARRLTLSEGTIRNVIARLTCKLGVADRTQAALLGCRAGLG